MHQIEAEPADFVLIASAELAAARACDLTGVAVDGLQAGFQLGPVGVDECGDVFLDQLQALGVVVGADGVGCLDDDEGSTRHEPDGLGSFRYASDLEDPTGLAVDQFGDLAAELVLHDPGAAGDPIREYDAQLPLLHDELGSRQNDSKRLRAGGSDVGADLVFGSRADLFEKPGRLGG